jgi:hypothetical protein
LPKIDKAYVNNEWMSVQPENAKELLKMRIIVLESPSFGKRFLSGKNYLLLPPLE